MRQWKILIIDDSAEDRAVCRRLLLRSMQTTYLLEEADTATQGLLVCATFQPDCILVDYHLPDLTGLQFLTQLRARMGA